jgi:SAM-dependent methyltransferase
MSVKEVASDHDFFDPAYIKRWTEAIARYRPERREVFKAFAAEIGKMENNDLSAAELGSGPGFLAESLLQNCRISRYALVDFSPQMLELSRKRLERFADRTVFFQRDFKKPDWTNGIPAGFDVIVSLQAVHELRHASRIPRLYAQLYQLLIPGGRMLICDHVNSPHPGHHQAAHFMTVAEHLASFKEAGFIGAREICPAADLSLMAAEKPK